MLLLLVLLHVVTCMSRSRGSLQRRSSTAGGRHLSRTRRTYGSLMVGAFLFRPEAANDDCHLIRGKTDQSPSSIVEVRLRDIYLLKALTTDSASTLLNKGQSWFAAHAASFDSDGIHTRTINTFNQYHIFSAAI